MSRLANAFRGGRVSAEIDEELEFHIRSRARDNVAAGMSDREARSDALLRMGGRLQAREKARDADMLQAVATVGQDIRFAVRALRRTPGVTMAAVVSLALAIGANAAIFTIVNAVILRDLPYQEPGRLAMVWMTNNLNGSQELNISVPNLRDWQSRNRSFVDMAAYRSAAAPLVTGGSSGEAEWISYAWVTGNFFDLMGRSPVLGRTFGANEVDDRASVAVVSRRLWQRRLGGSADALGTDFEIGGLHFRVIGVMADDFRFPSGQVDVWLPASLSPLWRNSVADRGSRFGEVIGRLKPGATLEGARREIQAITAQLVWEHPVDNANFGASVVPLQVQVNGKTVPFMLAILFGAVMLVLLIACANVASLLLARGVARSREMALRAALGAGRWRIARMLLTESLVLASAGGLLSLPCATWGVRALIAAAPANIARLDEVRVDLSVLLFAIGLSLASGILFGIAPALRISLERPSGWLRAHGRGTGGTRSAGLLRNAFVVCQIVLAVVLLAGTGLLVRSLLAVQAVNSGFGNRQVLTARLRFDNTLTRPRRVALYQQAVERIGRLPGVYTAGAVHTMFWDRPGLFGLRAVEGRPMERREQWRDDLNWTSIRGDYFQTLGVPLLRGRYFTAQDREDTAPVVLINQTMARRYWPAEDPLGKHIKGFDARGKNDDWVTIVGVVGDVHSRGLERTPAAQIFEAQSQSLDTTENLVVAASDGQRLIPLLRQTIRELDRTAALSDVATIGGRLDEMTEPRRFQARLIAGFAVLALVLAAAGIFGTMHYSVMQRTQEIGVRMALGARKGNVLGMVLREGMVLTVTGLALGVAGSMLLMRMLSSLWFGVRSEDPLTFAAVTLLLAMVALAGSYIPARRATKIDPMIALRCD